MRDGGADVEEHRVEHHHEPLHLLLVLGRVEQQEVLFHVDHHVLERGAVRGVPADNCEHILEQQDRQRVVLDHLAQLLVHVVEDDGGDRVPGELLHIDIVQRGDEHPAQPRIFSMLPSSSPSVVWSLSPPTGQSSTKIRTSWRQDLQSTL